MNLNWLELYKKQNRFHLIPIKWDMKEICMVQCIDTFDIFYIIIIQLINDECRNPP